MKRLTCEMCGSTDLIKENGVFVCQNCGTKYSVEEAKKMMIEGTVDVSGSTVSVNKDKDFENYKKLMLNAFKAGNMDEATLYATKSLEISEDYMAYYIKGTSVGWSSSVKELRIVEAFNNWKSAIEIVPEDKAESLCKSINMDQHDLANALTTMYFRAQNDDVAYKFADSIQYLRKVYLLQQAELVSAYGNRVVDGTLSNSSFSDYLSDCIPSLQCNEATKFLDEELNELERAMRIYSSPLSSESFKEKFLNFNGANIIYHFIEEERQTDYLLYFKKKVNEFSNICKAKKVPLNYSVFNDIYQQTDEMIKKVDTKRIEVLKKQQEKRNTQYWEEHAAEKEEMLKSLEQLKNEQDKNERTKKELEEKVKELTVQMETEVPAEKDAKEVKERIQSLQNQFSKLGLFKGKEKKVLQETIDKEKNDLAIINRQVEEQKNAIKNEISPKIEEIKRQIKPYQDKISEIKKHIKDINIELTKDR